MFKRLVITFVLLFGFACSTAAPTPILIGSLKDNNNEVVALYKDCSKGANYAPELETCQSDLLLTSTLETMNKAENFIKADYKQPHGYDIYLSMAMLYFRVSREVMGKEYTRAEQIARQFFEVQKASGGKSVDLARLHLVHFTAANASRQYFEDRLALDADRKAEISFAIAQGNDVYPRVQGPRLIRLNQDLKNLDFILNTMD